MIELIGGGQTGAGLALRRLTQAEFQGLAQLPSEVTKLLRANLSSALELLTRAI
jgi:hypothetical protein